MSKKILTKKLKQDIAELVATGLDVTQACIKLGSIVKPQTVYKEQVKDTEFAALMDTAYNSFIMSKVAELNSLTELSPTELYPNLDFRDAAEKRRGRIDAIKFILAKLAPQLSKRWDKVTKVEQVGNTGISVIIADYFKPIPVNTIDHLSSESTK